MLRSLFSHEASRKDTLVLEVTVGHLGTGTPVPSVPGTFFYHLLLRALILSPSPGADSPAGFPECVLVCLSSLCILRSCRTGRGAELCRMLSHVLPPGAFWEEEE